MSPNLNLLRAVAVLCVFFAHLYDTYTRTISDLTWHFGQVGVLMFFVHTSIVLMQSLGRSTGIGLFKQFYLQRFFRLYPFSIVCVLLSYLFVDGWTLAELFSNLTLTTNLTYSRTMVEGLWTLPLEVQMYLMLPFLFVWFRNRPVYWLIALWVLCIPFAILQPMITGRLSIVEYIPCFLAGVIAWRMLGVSRFPGWLWPFALAATTVVWMISTREHSMYYRWAFCLTLGLTIPWFRDGQSKWLNLTAKTVAKYSFGIYLSHQAVMDLVFVELDHLPLRTQWTLFVPLAVCLPIVAYHLIEHPMIQLGRAIIERRRAAAVVAAD